MLRRTVFCAIYLWGASAFAAVTASLSINESNPNSSHSRDGSYSLSTSLSGTHNSSSTGTRTTSRTFYERETGSWVNRGGTASFNRSNGAYSYYVKVCYDYQMPNKGLFGGGSPYWLTGPCINTPVKTINVTRIPGRPESITAEAITAFGASHQVSWGNSYNGNRFVLEQRNLAPGTSWSGWREVYRTPLLSKASVRHSTVSTEGYAANTKLQYRIKSFYYINGKTGGYSNVRESSEITVPSGPSFNVSDASVSEGGVLQFTVSKTGGTTVSHNVNYATENQRATDDDYIAKSGTLIFAKDETSKTVSIDTVDDNRYEYREWMHLNLSTPSNGAHIADGQGVGNIINEDAFPVFEVTDTAVTEGGKLAFVVKKMGASTLTHNINYTAANGTASGNDYSATSGTLSFSPNSSSQTVTVDTMQDSLRENNETVLLNLSGATRDARIGDGQGVGTINDPINPLEQGYVDTTPLLPEIALPTANLDELVESDATLAFNGEFSVNESGAANYHVPIMTFQGVAGVAPQVGLHYASNAGNGIAGVGWSISGLSSISRCRQTLYQDGQSKPISWTSEDRFCLDGQRLVLQSGSYGGQGSTYKTEIDSFVEVTYHAPYFTVTRKDGSTSYYGQSSDARVGSANNRILSWAINRMEDSVGNPISFHYLGGQDDHRIDEIRYAFNQSGSGHHAHISFAYEGRSDTSESYVAGDRYRSTRRLKSITSFNDGQALRRYNLGYNEPTQYGKYTSRLTSIEQCRDNQCLPNKLTFDWTLPQKSLVNAGSSYFSSQNNYAAQFTPMDINGDGLTDIAWLDIPKNFQMAVTSTSSSTFDRTIAVRYAINQGPNASNRFSERRVLTSYTATSNTIPTITAIDYNADGRQDLLYSLLGNNTIYPSVPDIEGQWKLDHNKKVAGPVGSLTRHYADINSDGLIDHYQAPKGTNKIAVRYLKRASNQPASSSNAYQFMPEKMLDIDFPDSGNDWRIYSFVKGGMDIDGDGSGDFEIRTAQQYQDTCWSSIGGPTLISEPCTRYKNQRSDYYAIRGDRLVRLQNIQPPPADHGIRKYVDLNNDGLTDVISLIGSEYKYFNSRTLLPNGEWHYIEDGERHLAGGEWQYRINTGNGFGPARVAHKNVDTKRVDTNPIFIDLNQDGYLDMAYRSYSSFATDNKGIRWLAWSKASNSFEHGGLDFDGENNAFDIFASDLNGDGNTDLAIYRGVGTTDLGGNAELVSVLSSPNNKANLITRIKSGFGAITDIKYEPLTLTDQYSTIAGVNTQSSTKKECRLLPPTLSSPSYSECWDVETWAIDSAAFYRHINAPFAGLNDVQNQQDVPVIELMAPLYVVTNASSSSPIAGNEEARSSISYLYEQAKIQAGGRGMLGFKSLTTIDKQTSIRTKTSYRQDWPFTGAPILTEVRTDNDTPEDPSDDTLLSRAENTMSLYGLDNGAAVKPYQPYIASSKEITYSTTTHSSSPLRRLLVSSNKTQQIDTQTKQDGYGNVLSLRTWTQDLGGSGDTIEKHVVNTYGTSQWEKQYGRLTRAENTTTRGSDSQTRVATFAYHPEGNTLEGLLYEEVIQPEGADNETLTTTYEHDSQGNIIGTTVSGHDGRSVVNRTSTAAYDTNGRYLLWQKNHVGQTVKHITERNEYGAAVRVNNIHGAGTTTYYTPMGQAYFVSGPDGSWTSTLGKSCNSGCPQGAVVLLEQSVAGGGRSMEYKDLLGRTIQSAKLDFIGQWIKSDTQYDRLGRAVKVSDPYRAGSPSHWTATRYDILSRPLTIIASNGSVGETHYDGYTTTFTNDKGQKRIETKNSLGELIRVEDNEGGTLTYSYDAESRLRTVTADGPDYAEGISGAIVISISYDKLGRKTAMSDPDKGNWTYRYNAFGELHIQRDAKGQSSILHYDAMGRLLERFDKRTTGSMEGATRWTYNNSLNLNGRGQVSAISYLGNDADGDVRYYKTPAYDYLGRLIETEIKLTDGSLHYEKTSYDQFGRTHQVFDSARQGRDYSHSAIQHLYNDYGYWHKVVDAAQDTDGEFKQVYYEAQNTDVRGNVTHALTGDGYQSVKIFNPRTGLLETTKVDNLFGVGTTVLELATPWDTIGNLISKTTLSRDDNGNLLSQVKEDFGYDNLNRLASTNVIGGGNTEIRYDSFGNIKEKNHYHASGALNSEASPGTYTYGQNTAGPHAVTHTSIGSISYQYDATGNMLSDNTRSLTYSTFDKPLSIQKGEHTTRFRYGPDRARYQRTDTNSEGTKTTLYIGNVEKITHTDGSKEVKRYINGVAIISQSYTGAGEFTGICEQYLHKDHLGSLTLITEFDGVTGTTQAQHLDFDPWGQRRSAMDKLDLSHASLINFDTSRTNRGFTGHEMLDEVGLIHMNGRIYDQKLGRFMQADPFIQASTNTQSYNRYSYLWNNPLNATDPSGYFLKKLLRSFASIPILDTAIQIVFTFVCQVCLVAYSAASTYAVTGSFASAFTAAFTSLVSPGAFESAFLGGVTSVMNGGKFEHGFVSAGIGALIGGQIQGISNIPAKIAASAILGGTISKLNGGKFANGAATAAFSAAVTASISESNEDSSSNTLGEDKESKVKLKAVAVLDETKVYSSEAKALAAADEAVAAMGNEYEWSSLVVKKGISYYITHVATSLNPKGVGYTPSGIEALYDEGYSIEVAHHNHPKNPYFSTSDRNYSRGLTLSNRMTNTFKVTMTHGNNRIRFVDRSMRIMTVPEISRNYDITRQRARVYEGELVKGVACSNKYVCN